MGRSLLSIYTYISNTLSHRHAPAEGHEAASHKHQFYNSFNFDKKIVEGGEEGTLARF